MNNKMKIPLNIITSGIAVVLTYIITFILTPYISTTFGVEAYGYVSLARNIASYFSIFTLALNSYATRFISVSYMEGNIKESKKYFNTVFWSNCIFALSSIIVLCPILFFLEYIIDIPSALIFDVKLLFFFIILNTIIAAVGTCFSTYAYIKNKLIIANLFKCMSYVFEGIVLIVLYKVCKPNLFFVGIGILVSGLIVLIGNSIMTHKHVSDLKIEKKNFSGKKLRKLLGNGLWDSINSLGNLLNSGLDLLITNILISSFAMGQLSVAKTISTMILTLFTIVSQTFQPIFLRDYSENNTNKLKKDLKFSMKISGLLSNLFFAGFLALGMPYYKLWIPDQDFVFIYKLTVICILSNVMEGCVYPLYYVYTLKIKNKLPCLLTILTGIVNLLSMIIIINNFSKSLYVVVWTTVIVMNLISLIFTPIYSAKCLGERCGEFYPTIIRHSLSLIFMCVAFYIFSQIIMPKNWIILILTGCFFVGLGTIIHFAITLTKDEIKTAVNNIKNKINGLKSN